MSDEPTLPHFTSDLQIISDKPSAARISSQHDDDGEIGPRVAQKWSILGPMQYVNVPSSAPIYDPDQPEGPAGGGDDQEPSDLRRWMRLGVWLSAWVSLVVFIYGCFLVSIHQSIALLVIFLVLFLVCLALYLRGQLLSTNVEYLKNIALHEGTPEYIDQLRLNKPKIVFSIRCFHYSMAEGFSPHEHQFEGEAGNGNRDVERGERDVMTEGDFRKITTFELQKEFAYDGWEDQSLPLTGIDRFEMIKLKLNTRIGFADEFTKQKFQEEQDKFIEENKGKDSLYEYKCFFEVPDLRPKSLSIVNAARKPPLLSIEWYMTFTFLLLGWPYNYWLDIKSTKVNYIVQKVVKREPTEADLIRRAASDRRLARKTTSSSVRRTTSKQISRKPTDSSVAPPQPRSSFSGPAGEASPPHQQQQMEQDPGSGGSGVAGGGEDPNVNESPFVSEYPFEFSSPRGNFP